MLHASEDEKANIVRYFLSQSSSDSRVDFLQKVYAETLMGHRHDVWDLHTSEGRWWVITNPTNLYSQDQFPNMDLAVTFHMGLCLRIPRTQRQRIESRRVLPFGEVFNKLREANDALHQAHNVADYQAIGVRSREALLAYVAAAQDASEWPVEQPPKRADFRGWNDVICDTILSGGSQKDRRHLFKSLLCDAWSFANWLTHAHSATWHDAEAALSTVEHGLGLATSLVLRHIRMVPEECPDCGSPHLSPQEGYNDELPEVVWERPTCEDCRWTGKPVPVGELDADDGLFRREGGSDSDECIVMEVPLRDLKKPNTT
ncbi:hypothetical protein HFO04_00590 [Rhizobium laguerreae]|uniref:Gamma-glutamylcyclotransferase n=2 Tax=Rhizobium laguerreae TaxID=1076926 RepID=A0ABR6G8X5_9HYPH|nr:hypothetical protein [Rhizobium laguerreae]MBB3162395.1 hypothetical protein [Rhizobium laguerreae]MBY3096578.1 hypothetical protein [Rhizobium laguerreae]MBY3124894.1 hypothetical protein [Rhizobium laguerreae]MBY3242588.1 hypothetical protein [Rhizobium laguerreae]MBY3301311.1 hypothetical protein [Rhizobium laguerreae]